ncbi:uncharacterized protein VTP21DRAFT_9476 [Calcarisporiella thermophila]|uniref:uncharacterized protein n=1 Tax=Calcarisporiella thermophila TaxID=911321 RepID=UPI003742277A
MQSSHTLPSFLRVCVILYLLTLALGRSLEKRQDPVCNTYDIYCAPTESSTWDVGSFNKIIWNNRQPDLSTQTTVDLYLYPVGSSAPVKQWLAIDNNGSLPIFVEKEWFKGILSPNASGQFQFQVGYGDSRKPPGPTFFIREPSEQPVTTTIFTSVISTTIISGSVVITQTHLVPLSQLQSSASNSLPTWVIGLISAAGAFVIIAVAIALLIFRNSRNRKRRTTLTSNLSLSSQTSRMTMPLGDIAGGSSRSLLKSHGPGRNADVPGGRTRHLSGEGKEEEDASSRVLSMTDAMLIANAFRQQMRKPTWEQGENESECCEDLAERGDMLGVEEKTSERSSG